MTLTAVDHRGVYGNPIHYPKLWDREWMLERAGWRCVEVAKEVGCSPEAVSKRRLSFGLRSLRKWTELEREMLRAFWQYPKMFLAKGVGRSLQAVYDQGRHERERGRMPLPLPRNGHAGKMTIEEEQFFEEWRAYISESWQRWGKEDRLDEALALTWIPPLVENREDCCQCSEVLRLSCKRAKWLFCERVVVGQVVESLCKDSGDRSNGPDYL